jgi:flagellar hook-associated protein 2
MTTTSSTSAATGPVVSVASNTSSAAAGGSVIDVSSLVSQLVAATRAPQDSLIAAQTQTVTTQISAVGTLKGALSTFQSALGSLDTPGAFNAVSAASTNSGDFTATASSDATSGTYNVTISQLAQAQQLVSGAFSGGSAASVGTGTLSLALGGTSFSVAINSTNNTVAGVAAAINAAAGNPGIEATVITGTDGAHLVLSSSLTGAANTIAVSETDGGGGLSSFTYGSGNSANYTQVAAAQDAQFSIAGIPYTSASNTVSSALSGVTLTLLGTTGSGGANLMLANDTSTVAANVSSFVQAYNTLVSSLSSLNSYDATTGTAGPMLGDALLSGIQNQIRSVLYSVVDTGSSTYNSLASIGVTTNSDGTLSLNSATLQTALSSNFSSVNQLFSGANGVAANLNTQITSDLASGGSIDSRSQTLVKQENSLTQQTDTLNAQMDALTTSLTQQYSALNTLLSSLQTTSAYLSQAFSNLPTVQSKANA